MSEITSLQNVTQEMNLGEVAAKFPQAARVMLEYGLHCVGCFASSFDSVEQGALLHGMTDEEISGMLKEMNEAIREHPEETIEGALLTEVSVPSIEHEI